MLKAGLHFGHIPSKRHPKMKPFIFGVRSGVHIIDLEQTQHLLDQALAYAKEIAAKGGVVLFVATKRQAQSLTKEAAERCGMPYIHEHWIGGLLTNFTEIKKVIRRYNMLKKRYEDNDFAGMSKKEKVMLDKEFEKLKHKVSGISTLTKAPDAIFMIDIKKEKTGLTEATKMHIPVIAVCDSNTNPELVAHPIPGNDDATKAITLMMSLMADAVAEGKQVFEKAEAENAKKEAAAADKAKKEKAKEKEKEDQLKASTEGGSASGGDEVQAQKKKTAEPKKEKKEKEAPPKPTKNVSEDKKKETKKENTKKPARTTEDVQSGRKETK